MKKLLLYMFIGFMGLSVVQAQTVTDKGRVMDAYPMTADLWHITSDEQGTVLAVGENSVCLLSNDGGNTWKQILASESRFLQTASILSPTSFVVFARKGQHPSAYIALTHNSGDAWDELQQPLYSQLQENEHPVTFVSDNTNSMYVGTSSGRIFRYSFSSKNWEQHAIPDSIAIQELYIADDQLYAITVSDIYMIEGNAVTRLTPDIAEIGFVVSNVGIIKKANSLMLFVRYYDSTSFRSFVQVYEKSEDSEWQKTDTITQVPSKIYAGSDSIKYILMSFSSLQIVHKNGNVDTVMLFDDNQRFYSSTYRSAYITATGEIFMCGDNKLIAFGNAVGEQRILSELPNKLYNPPAVGIFNPYKYAPVTIANPYGGSLFFAATTIENLTFPQGSLGVRNDNKNYIYVSRDSGVTWQLARTIRLDEVDTQGYIFHGLLPNGDFYFSSNVTDNFWSIVRTSDSGKTWDFYYPRLNNTNRALFPPVQPPIVLKTGETLMVLSDGPNTYNRNKRQLVLSSDGFKNDVRRLVSTNVYIRTLLSENEREFVFSAATINGTVVKYGIATYKMGEDSVRFVETNYGMDVFYSYNNKLFAIDSVGLFVSNDTVKTWELVVANPPGTIFTAAANQESACWLIASDITNDVNEEMYFFHTQDGGNNWAKMRIKEHYHINDKYRTAEFAQNTQSFSMMEILSDKSVIARSYGTGHSFILSIDPTATSVTEETSDIEALPGGWLYSPNPNPATTVLRADVRLYTGMSVQQCKLGLYDISSGKLMYDATPELQRMAQSGGRTTIEIPTAGIPTGAYLLQLTTEKSIHTRKVVINR